MRDRPNIPDEQIVAKLENAYGLALGAVEFLPIGNDAASAVFRVDAKVDGKQRAFFLKLRRDQPNPASLRLPHHLRMQGIHSVVAPLATNSGELFAECDQYSLILYPWIDGESKLGKPLCPRMWRAWGAMMRAIHSVGLGKALQAQTPQEQYGKRWQGRLEKVERALGRIRQSHEYAHDFALEYAIEYLIEMEERWREYAAQIEQARQRYAALASRLKARQHEHVICHADIHPANIIVDKAGAIHIVDWDEVMLAPKERDLMYFIVDGHAEDAVAAFMDGYGDCQVDRAGIAYYRYDWLLQEFCDYGERVFLSPGLSERELRFAVDEFERLFAPGDVHELAEQAYDEIEE